MRILLVALLLAGCLQPESPTATPETTPEDPGADVPEPRLIGPGADVESAILVRGDTILICSHGGFYQPSPLWASTDAGETFRRIDPQPNPLVSGDCDLAITDSGRWLIVYDTIASATIAWSDDEGATWSFNYAAALPIAVDRPWIHAVGDVVYMTYSDVMAAEPAIQMFARSEDGGATWLDHTPINLAQPPDRLQAVIGKMQVSDDGQIIHVPLARSNIQTGGPVYLDVATSRDAGATWTIDTAYGPYQPDGLVLPVMARAGELLHYVVPLASDGHDVAVITNAGDGWSEPVVVATDVHLPQVTAAWIDGRPDGSATVAWIAETDAGWIPQAAMLAADGTVGPIVDLAEPTDRGQGIGHEFLMVDHDDAGRAHVAWVMNTGDDCDPEPNPVESRGIQCMYLGVI